MKKMFRSPIVLLMLALSATLAAESVNEPAGVRHPLQGQEAVRETQERDGVLSTSPADSVETVGVRRLGFLDNLVDRVAFTFRTPLRAGMHVLRDLLFPEVRKLPAEKRAATSFLDRPISGETPEDFAARIALRDKVMEWADWARLPELHARHTTLFRYGIAVATGLILMAVLLVIHRVSSLVAKVCLRVCLRVTRHEAFADDDSDGELALGWKYEQEREAKQAEKERLKAQKGASAAAGNVAGGAAPAAAAAATTTSGTDATAAASTAADDGAAPIAAPAAAAQTEGLRRRPGGGDKA